jgi:hypothetical protein
MSSGVVAGQLTRTFAVADVPLQGPGSWLLVTNGTTQQKLHCGLQETIVTNMAVIGANQSCQFEISAMGATMPISWQLTPAP